MKQWLLHSELSQTKQWLLHSELSQTKQWLLYSELSQMKQWLLHSELSHTKQWLSQLSQTKQCLLYSELLQTKHLYHWQKNNLFTDLKTNVLLPNIYLSFEFDFYIYFLYAYTCTISTRDMYQAVKLSNIVQWDLYKTIRWNFIILYSFHSFALLVRTLTSTRLRWYVSSPSTLLYLPSLISLFWATIQDC